MTNKLYYGDNVEVMRQSIAAESVDLIYLDPPFNSNRNYNVIFRRHATERDADKAQIQAFGDTWVWTPVTEQQYQSYVGGGLPNEVADALTATFRPRSWPLAWTKATSSPSEPSK